MSISRNHYTYTCRLDLLEQDKHWIRTTAARLLMLRDGFDALLHVVVKAQ